jgi:hypothetical protein
MRKIAAAGLFLVLLHAPNNALECSLNVDGLKRRATPMVEQIQKQLENKKPTMPNKESEQQALLEVNVDGRKYRLTKTTFDFMEEKDEPIGSNNATLKLVGIAWHEDFTSEALCGEFFNYVTNDKKKLDAFIVVFANGDVKIYLFKEDEVVKYPYVDVFNAGNGCSIKTRKIGDKTLFEITGEKGNNAIYDLKDGEL